MGWDSEGYSGGWGGQKESNSWGDSGKADADAGTSSWDRGGESNNNYWNADGAEEQPKKVFVPLPDDHPYIKMSEQIESMLGFIKGMKETHLEMKELEDQLEKSEQFVSEAEETTKNIEWKTDEFKDSMAAWEKDEAPQLEEAHAEWTAKIAALEEKVKNLPLGLAEAVADDNAAEAEAGDAAENSWGQSNDQSSWGQEASGGAGDYAQGSSSWDRGGSEW